MNTKKLLTLAILVTGLASNLSINAMEKEKQCHGKECKKEGQSGEKRHEHHREHHQHHEHQHYARPNWENVVVNNVTSEAVIKVKENNTWVHYKKTDTVCPQREHRYGREHKQGAGHWRGHQHKEEYAGKQHEHHKGHRHVKYQYKNGEHVDGVLNVFENGECNVYTRTTTIEEIEKKNK